MPSSNHSALAGTGAPWRVLAIATWQQAALTFVRFGVPALAPFLRGDFHLSLSEIGLVLGAFNVGAFLVFYPTGRATERYGEAVVMGLGAAAVGLACIALVMASTWTAIAIGLAIAGIGFPSSQVAGSRAVYTAFAKRRRGLAMGVRQAGLPLGGLLAALILPWLASRWGWRAAIAAAAAVAFSGALLCAAMPQAHRGKRTGKQTSAMDGIRTFFRRADLLAITLMATLLAFSQFCAMSYLPLYLVDDFHLSKALAALSLIGVQIGGIAGRLFWGFVSDRWAGGDRTGTLVGICLGGGAAAVALTTGSSLAVFAVSGLAGLTLLGWNGLYVTLLSERAGTEAATMLSLSMMILYVAAMLAPPAFGQAVQLLGYRIAWIGLLVPQLVAAALALIVSRLPSVRTPID